MKAIADPPLRLARDATRFDRRWKPGGTGVAECLRAAQAEIRAVPKWQDPRCWAAWVVRGLPH